jgi:hypothetical protein
LVPYRNHSMANLTNESPSRAEQAIEAFQEADRVDAKPRVGFGDDIVFKLDAEYARTRAYELLEPAGIVGSRCGRGSDLGPGVPRGADPELEVIVNTLERPNSVGVGALVKVFLRRGNQWLQPGAAN